MKIKKLRGDGGLVDHSMLTVEVHLLYQRNAFALPHKVKDDPKSNKLNGMLAVVFLIRFYKIIVRYH